ncbi:MAG TPA: alpha-amylase family protein [Thermoleophilaceae bacterium]|nr:alpha-amylase family protein [Thermoleophilaceae bacterium]
MRLDETSDQWWKNAIVYCLDVETFIDSDSDGVGDFRGLIRQVDYIAGLGVNCIWLMPFQPSPDCDDGYDITDYYSVDPRLGTLGDFVEFVRTANDRGIRVVIDLVLNHTSIEHPWFQDARSSRDDPKRGWYVWRDEPSDVPKGLFFPNRETSNWAFDEEAGQWYLHRFYSFQADLDTANPEVRDEIARILGYWLQLGVSGFRLDAVPALLETSGLPERVSEDPREWLRCLRTFVNRRRGDAALLGELNVNLTDLAGYFGEHGDLLHMQFAFLMNQQLWLALAREEAEPLEAVIRELPKVPPDNAWATFLRNHDELTLDKLTAAQRDEIFAAFGPKKNMQVYGHGLRRRLAPMLDGDPDRLRLAWSLVFSLPGTPVILYGDEIGLGENLALDDRMAVRVPMQWSGDPSGGFSTAAAKDLVRPLATGKFGPKDVNVAEQRREEDSLLNWMARLIRRRRESPEFGWGAVTLLETQSPSLFAHRCDWEGSTVIAVHNLGEARTEATITLDDDVLAIDDMLEAREHEILDGGKLKARLGRYGYLWLRVRREGERKLS